MNEIRQSLGNFWVVQSLYCRLPEVALPDRTVNERGPTAPFQCSRRRPGLHVAGPQSCERKHVAAQSRRGSIPDGRRTFVSAIAVDQGVDIGAARREAREAHHKIAIRSVAQISREPSGCSHGLTSEEPSIGQGRTYQKRAWAEIGDESAVINALRTPFCFDARAAANSIELWIMLERLGNDRKRARRVAIVRVKPANNIALGGGGGFVQTIINPLIAPREHAHAGAPGQPFARVIVGAAVGDGSRLA